MALATGVPAMGLACAYMVWAGAAGPSLAQAIASGSEGFAYAIAGTIGWSRHPQYRTGPLMAAAAYLTLVGALQRFTDSGALYAVGSAFSGVQEGVFAYLLLTFPSGRPAPTPIGWLARLLVVASVALPVADLLTRPMSAECQNPLGFCTTQANPFLVVDLGSTVVSAGSVAVPVLAAATFVAVLWRLLEARGAARRALAPVLAAGVLVTIAVVLRGLSSLAVEQEGLSTLSRITEVGIPIALGVGFIRSRMSRAGVATLLLQAGSQPTPRGLEAAVRRTLHDPTARLLRWSAVEDRYLDADGKPTEITPGPERDLTVIADGERLGAIQHDPVLAEEGDLLASVAAAARIVLENERLASSLQAQVADASRLPTGIVTLMRTDIEGSTEILASLGPRYGELLLELRRLLRDATRQGDGTEIDSRADEFFAAFPDPVRALQTAIDIQRQVAVRQWPGTNGLRIRMGLHTGEPSLTREGYVGLDVHLAARVSATGSGGQIVVSDATQRALNADHGAFELRELGAFRLKGIPRTVTLFQLDTPGNAVDYPPLHAERAAS